MSLWAKLIQGIFELLLGEPVEYQKNSLSLHAKIAPGKPTILGGWSLQPSGFVLANGQQGTILSLWSPTGRRQERIWPCRLPLCQRDWSRN